MLVCCFVFTNLLVRQVAFSFKAIVIKIDIFSLVLLAIIFISNIFIGRV